MSSGSGSMTRRRIALSPTELVRRLGKIDLANPEIDYRRAEAALSRAISRMGLLPLKPVWLNSPDKSEGDPFLATTFSMFGPLTFGPPEVVRIWDAAWQHFYPRPAPQMQFMATGPISDQWIRSTTSRAIDFSSRTFFTTG